jgi:hypothetical protein
MAKAVEWLAAERRILVGTLLAEDDSHVRLVREDERTEAIDDTAEIAASIRNVIALAGLEHANDGQLESASVAPGKGTASSLLRFVLCSLTDLVRETLRLEDGREQGATLGERRDGVHCAGRGRGVGTYMSM